MLSKYGVWRAVGDGGGCQWTHGSPPFPLLPPSLPGLRSVGMDHIFPSSERLPPITLFSAFSTSIAPSVFSAAPRTICQCLGCVFIIRLSPPVQCSSHQTQVASEHLECTQFKLRWALNAKYTPDSKDLYKKLM